MTTSIAAGERDPARTGVVISTDPTAPTDLAHPGGPPAGRRPVAGQVRTLTGQARAVAGRAAAAVRAESLLVAVLVGSFLARWLIADRNSYWLDELLSVAVYGVWNDSLAGAVSRLATQSIHPPLYQATLYQWMEWFGDGERATRSLSNLCITLATLFLYLLLRDAFSRRVALASAITFALMYSPFYYALETRSYAMTIFLVTLSSYSLLRMMRAGAARGWLPALYTPATGLFLAASLAMLLIHYFNFFFLAAQAVLAGGFVLRERPVRGWPAGLATVATLYAVPAGAFALIWGEVMLSDLRRRGGAIEVAGPIPDPLELLASVIQPNLDPPAVLRWLGLALLGWLAIRVLVALARPGGLTTERQRAWTTGYLLAWLAGPVLVAYAVFSVTGLARFSERYWLYVIPALAPLVVLAVEEAVRLAGRAWQRLRGRGQGAGTGWAMVGTAAIIATLILPGTLAAATQPKADWRGTAQDIIAIVDSDPQSRYLLYEVSFNRSRYLDYYLQRYGSDVRVAGNIRRSVERSGEEFAFERDAEVIAQYDYLIVAFAHHRTSQFPDALQKLSATYRVQHWQVGRNGQGLIIFAIDPAGAQAPAAPEPREGP
jgi:4-amino-4-deoxy-L-arabinose transferase-like glycosyltransferase